MPKSDLRLKLEALVDHHSYREVLHELVEMCYQHIHEARPNAEDTFDRHKVLAHRLTQAEEWCRRFDL